MWLDEGTSTLLIVIQFLLHLLVSPDLHSTLSSEHYYLHCVDEDPEIREVK